MTESKLTGQTRLRTNWFKKLILQVEIDEKWFTTGDGWTYRKVWRDARVEDLSVLRKD